MVLHRSERTKRQNVSVTVWMYLSSFNIRINILCISAIVHNSKQ